MTITIAVSECFNVKIPFGLHENENLEQTSRMNNYKFVAISSLTDVY